MRGDETSSSISSPRITDNERDIVEAEEEGWKTDSDSLHQRQRIYCKSSLNNRLFNFLGLIKTEQRENTINLYKCSRICKTWKEKYQYDLYEMHKLVSNYKISNFEESTIEEIEAKIIETGILEKWNEFLMESRRKKKRFRTNIQTKDTPQIQDRDQTKDSGALVHKVETCFATTNTKPETLEGLHSLNTTENALKRNPKDQNYRRPKKRRVCDLSEQDSIIAMLQHVTL